MRILRWSDVCPGGDPLHVAYVVGPTGGSWKIHGHDFCEVFWVDSGRGTHILPTGEIPLVAGQLVFIRARDVHGFRAEASAEPFAIINAAFSARAWAELRDRYGLASHPVFDEAAPAPPSHELAGETRAETAKLFRGLIHEKRTALSRDAFLLALARRVGGVEPHPGLAAAPAWLRQALIHFLAEPDSLRGGAAGLASRAGCSPGHLARAMRRYLGESPTSWIQSARLRRAAQMLESTGLSVSDIALESGFDNLSHFHRRFRAAYGRTPLRYRKERATRVV